MAEETNNEFLTAKPSEGGEFELLETGAYTGVCVGLTKREFKKYQSTEMEPKFQFVFQVVDGDTNHYLRTLPFRNVINDKSNLFVFLNSWLGVTLEKAANGIDLGKTIGLKAQIVVGESERDGKKFNTIENVLKAKKNDKTEFVADDKAPAWLNKGPFIASHWIDGLAFAEAVQAPEEDSDEALVKYAEQVKAKAEADEDSELPFN